MPNHRQESVRTPKSAFRKTASTGRSKGPSTRNKVMAAVVAAGAFAAIGQPIAANVGNSDSQAAVQPMAERQAQAQPLAPAVAGTEQAPASVNYLAAPAPQDSQAEAQKLDKSKALEQAKAEKAAADKAAADKAAAEKAAAEKQAVQARAVVPAAAQGASGYVKPTEGTFTSGFGARWGSSHKGIDIANSIGTPIKSVAAGEVINAGPASGFGQWVRVQHNDGTITVYGHINTIDVKVGQKVAAGEKIATLGNKGQSTGPHLHFEVIEDGSKINPMPWLKDKGIAVQ